MNKNGRMALTRAGNRIPPYKDIHDFVGCGAIFTAPLQAFHYYQSYLTKFV
jgi:hypothetical protein